MRKIICPAAALIISLLLFSCGSVPVNSSQSQSWRIPEKNTDGSEIRGTVRLAGVSVDRLGGWDSLEKEVKALAPLYFWKHGYRISGSGTADYAAHISLREREIISGWRTRRSLALEVKIWTLRNGEAEAEELFQELPAAAGRIVATGNRSFT
ncbi:MAG: hypothetical protein FWH38_09715, partial [Treponema sp.]|nr:hypothetical protein [Treponema sp.]